VKINGVKGKMDADSCSSANVMDESQFSTIAKGSPTPIRLVPVDRKLFAYAQEKPIELAGKFRATITSSSTGQSTEAEFLVIKGKANSRPLLSLETSVKLQVLHVTHTIDSSIDDHIKIFDRYPSVFQGLGKHKYIKARLIVDNDVTPVVQKRGKIAYNLEKKAREEEERLLEIGVIEKVPDSVPTTWCTNPVVAPKPRNPSAIRYCSNMRVPNVAIKRPMTEALTVEDVKVRLAGSSMFTVLDMNESYHQLELELESRHLTTFYGTDGRYRYKRLNYGTISAQDIFDKAMDDTIQGLDDVLHIRDDFVVHGASKEDHDKALLAFLNRMQENGLTLNRKKAQVGVDQVEFFGFIFSANGTSPAPSKVQAIKKMDPPTSREEVQSLIGMAQYSSQFIPQFADITAPLRNLTRSEVRWGKEEQAAFDSLKTSLSEDAVLGYYEVGLDTRLMVDAGPNGLGLVLLQRKSAGWQPVACHSRSLTDVEKRYSQMEREALAIRWACERCYQYLIGSPRFQVITDHKPLIPLFNNANSRPPLRVERWLMYLQQFDFELVYVQGKNNGADYLSRHALPHTRRDERQEAYRESVVKTLVLEKVPRAITLTEIQRATASDKVLGRVIKAVKDGTLANRKKDQALCPYARIASEISIAEDVVLRGTRIIVPKELQERVLDICHEGHQGIVKCKSLLRTKVWFPGIDLAMERKVKGCLPCQAAVTSHQRDPLVMTALPERPWEHVAADHIGPFPTGESLFVVIDEYSKYPEVEVVQGTTARETLLCLEKIIADKGAPVQLKSDNGSPFQSAIFHMYCEEKGIQHRRVTPRWPEGNGQAENFMKNLGKVARAAYLAGNDWRRDVYVYLGNYRSTPHASTGKSPRELMMDCTYRDKLPQLPASPPQSRVEVEKKHSAAKDRQKRYADERRGTKPHNISPGDSVLVRQQKVNKFTMPYEPVPYTVEKVKGSMVTAKHGRKSITRNSSAFKSVPLIDATEPVYITDDPEVDMVPAETAETPDDPHVQDQVPTAPVPGPSPAEYTRSGRQVKAPSWLGDYIVRYVV
jgi:hypothetical protein